MRLSDTIVAPASPPGRSPRAIIRVSGPATHDLLARTLVEPPRRPGAASGRLTLAPDLALPILLIRSDAPRSYTGQDTAELLLPGNPALVERVIQRLIEAGTGEVRPAEPGEFTARAYLAGKLTLAQAEGVAATIAAQTDDQLAAARAVLAGDAGRRYASWADELATLLALTEAGIDFVDQEDVVPIPPRDLARRVLVLRDAIGLHAGPRAVAEARGSLPRIVLIGAPNAGKSTLFNALLGRRRAVVSPIAGTTRDVLEDELDLTADGGGAAVLADVAGLDGAASCESAGPPEGPSIGAMAQDHAATAIAGADVLIHCDPAGRFERISSGPEGAVTLRVRTKADVPTARSPASTPGDRPGAESDGTLPVCALDGWNLGALRRAIADAAWGSSAGGPVPALVRHRRALASALAALDEAHRTIDAGSPRLADPELTAGALRLALDGRHRGRVVDAPAARRQVHEVEVDLHDEHILDGERAGDLVREIRRERVDAGATDADGGQLAQLGVVQIPQVRDHQDPPPDLLLLGRAFAQTVDDRLAQAVGQRPVGLLGPEVRPGDNQDEPVEIDGAGYSPVAPAWGSGWRPFQRGRPSRPSAGAVSDPKRPDGSRPDRVAGGERRDRLGNRTVPRIGAGAHLRMARSASPSHTHGRTSRMRHPRAQSTIPQGDALWPRVVPGPLKSRSPRPRRGAKD